MIRDQQILDYIVAHGPSLSSEICAAYGHETKMCGQAFRGLQHAGKIEIRREGHNGGASRNYWALPDQPKRITKSGPTRDLDAFNNVYALIRAFGPISHHEVQAGLGINENQAHNRLRVLSTSGKIVNMRGPRRRSVWWAV